MTSSEERAWEKVSDLENQIADIKANCDLAIEGRDIKIKELEKENEELRNNGFTVSAMTEQQLKEALEKGEQLEKKNKKLESDFRICEKNADTYYDQLTKAKKLLERLLITSCNSDVLNLLPNCSEVLRVRVEAEQFLSEVEK